MVLGEEDKVKIGKSFVECPVLERQKYENLWLFCEMGPVTGSLPLPPAPWVMACVMAGFGCIARDNHGVWLRSCSESLNESIIQNAKLFDIWRGLLLAWDNSYREVICECIR
ncbi:hypothetical protein PIB30_065082 [Stylosanthes scabra]|uniref:RNase H type-1 domain-containing protein n=1 Tax=Stylosanthes scabra TaxID=79078 RepID=A0ABU6RM97_9FABA|nr:hypothetical protein [Stylosanthes scabra]